MMNKSQYKSQLEHKGFTTIENVFSDWKSAAYLKDVL